MVKILIIKTFLVSQKCYELEMKAIPKNTVKEIDIILWDFLWDGKQPLINKKHMFKCRKWGNEHDKLHRSKTHKFIHKIINSKAEHLKMIGKNWPKSMTLKTFYISALALNDCQ